MRGWELRSLRIRRRGASPFRQLVQLSPGCFYALGFDPALMRRYPALVLIMPRPVLNCGARIPITVARLHEGDAMPNSFNRRIAGCGRTSGGGHLSALCNAARNPCQGVFQREHLRDGLQSIFMKGMSNAFAFLSFSFLRCSTDSSTATPLHSESFPVRRSPRSWQRGNR
jgi:hypothetical protein